MTEQPSDTVVTAWVRLLRAQRRALLLVEARLKEAGLPQLGWYDALLEIERAGEGGIRPFELERAILLEQYNLSRLIDRLERAGYVERRKARGDGRGQTLHSTEAGRAIRRRAWPVYAAAIQEAVGRRLSGAEADQLAALLRKLTELA
jgi:DNA-binding MarR family transcriptional regulator